MRKEYSAGGIVFQKSNDHVEMLLIKDRYGKISLPKGHVESGETTKQAALREVFEETGMIGKIVSEVIGSVTYMFEHPGFGQIEKVVTYYLIEAIGGNLQAQLSEIRQVLWVPIDQVYALHLKEGYENNHEIMKKAVDLLQNMY